MIYSALHCVTEQLNLFLMRRFSIQETKAILGNILTEAGAVPDENRNKIILSMVNLDHEIAMKNTAARKFDGDSKISQNLPYYFNIDILVSSLFNDYEESLKFLSETIYFFQANQYFTHKNSPSLDPNIQKLTIELVKVNYSEMNDIWTTMGAKYKPSVLFRIRMLSFQSGNSIEVKSTISSLDIDVKPK